MKDKQLLFIISQPRSGSTLTQRIIGSHPRVYTRSEPWIMLHSLYSLKQRNFQADFDAELWRPAFNDFIDHLPQGSRQGYIESLRQMHFELYENYLSAAGKEIFLDKTPRYYLIVDELYQVFPEAKFVLLLRHPLAVLSSILETWIGDDYPRLARHRHDLLTAIEKEVEFVEAVRENKCVVRYEDLLENPVGIVRQICRYAGLEYSDDLVRNYFSSDVSAWKYGDPVHAKSKSSIDTASKEKWLDGLASPQTWRFFHDYLQLIGKTNLEKLGYEYDETMSLLTDNMPLNSLAEIHRNTQSLQNCLGVGDAGGNARYDYSKKYNAFYRQIDDLKNTGCDFVIYGNGTVGKTIQALMPERIVGFVDRADLQNPFDKVIISVLGREREIRDSLINKLMIPEEKILLLDIED